MELARRLEPQARERDPQGGAFHPRRPLVRALAPCRLRRPVARGTRPDAAAERGADPMTDTDAATADAHYRSAMACCEQGRIAEGIELARKSLALDGGQARTHRLLGTALLHVGSPA